MYARCEDLPEHVALLLGCLPALENLLGQWGVRLAIEDKRESGAPLLARFQGQLTSIQREATQALLAHDDGVFVAPPGIGKTVVGAFLVAARARSTLILVHRQPLLEQWAAQLSTFLGFEPRAIGRIGSGKRTPTGGIDVAMLQSLVHGPAVDDMVASYGHVIVDECHHVPAVSFERVLSAVKARYVTGLTATPLRRDGHHPIIEMQIGPIRFDVDAKSHAALRPFRHTLVVRDSEFRFAGDPARATIQDLYRALSTDEARNRLLINDVLCALEHGRSPIVLSERKDHLDHLAEQLRPAARNLVILKGGMGARQRRETAARFASIAPHEERLVLATGRYIGEGFDDARLDTLFLALPVSWRGTLVQYVGRLHRLSPGKKDVQVFDYVDSSVPVLARMFERRLRGYRAMGYELCEVPPEYAEPTNDLVIEWDDEQDLQSSSDSPD